MTKRSPTKTGGLGFPTGGVGRAGLSGLFLLVLVPSGWAQVAGPGLQVSPTFVLESGYYETRGRLQEDTNGREGVVRVSPGLRVTSFSGRLRGSLDYAANLYYRRGRAASAGHEVQHSLQAAFTGEAIANRFFVDVAASVSQQTLSAFGQQSVEGSQQANSNQTEVATLLLSPYLRGSLGSWVAYDARVSVSGTDSRSGTATDSSGQLTSISLRSPRGGGALGWSLAWSQATTRYTNQVTDAAATSQLSAAVSYRPSPELSLALTGGHESVDSGGAGVRQDAGTVGAGFTWQPTVRTSMQVDLSERAFGRSNRVGFSHRMARSVLTYSLVKDTTTGADGLAFGQPMTLYQLLFLQKTSAYPDPAERDAAVLAELAAMGLDPNQQVAVSTVVSAYSLQRRQDFAWMWTGLRATFTAQAFTNATSQITTTANEPVFGEAVRQHGYSASWAYRLTPETSATLGGSRRMTFGTSTQAGTDLKSASIGLSSRWGRRTTAALSARYTVFNSTTDPYRETGLSGSLNLRF